jgi:hypothetical protein
MALILSAKRGRQSTFQGGTAEENDFIVLGRTISLGAHGLVWRSVDSSICDNH